MASPMVNNAKRFHFIGAFRRLSGLAHIINQATVLRTRLRVGTAAAGEPRTYMDLAIFGFKPNNTHDPAVTNSCTDKIAYTRAVMWK